MTDYRLDTAYLIFPQQYSRADYYLIFLNRLLQLHQNEQVILQSSDHQNELYHEFPGINMEGYFTFKIDENMREGAYYVDKSTGARLFYINFKRQLIRFNSQALTDLLVVDYSEKFDYKTVKRFETYLVAIGKYFKEDYGFDVDFNLLDASNNASYQISSADEPREALDKLFIISADAGYMLVAGESGRAVLQLKNNVVVSILRQAEHDDLNNASWVIKVQDEGHKVAWFDILYKYEFIKDWYLDNLTSLAIKSDERFF